MEHLNKIQPVIITDLDGTLLDARTMSFYAATKALITIKDRAIPLVFVTSKTFEEVKVLQQQMSLWPHMPFIIENGGAVYLPSDYHVSSAHSPSGAAISTSEGLTRISIGEPYTKVCTALRAAAQEAGVPIRGFHQLTPEDLARLIGFDVESAKRAKQRQYQESFSILSPPEKKAAAYEKLRSILKAQGYETSIGGGFYHAMKGGSKRKAVSLIGKILTVTYGTIRTLGLGDAQSDLAFLEICDTPYLLENDTRIVPMAKVPHRVQKVPEQGPAAWNRLVMQFISV